MSGISRVKFWDIESTVTEISIVRLLYSECIMSGISRVKFWDMESIVSRIIRDNQFINL